MKKLCCISLAMLLGTLLASTTSAAPSKGRAKDYTLYVEGQPAGDLQANPYTDHSYLSLQFERPGDEIPSSRLVFDRAGCSRGGCSNEPECAKYGPWIWAANTALNGRIRGDISVTLHTLASPGARVEVWFLADLQDESLGGPEWDGGRCPPPDAATIVELPPGKAVFETTIKDVDFSADASLYFGVAPILGDPPIFARIEYGASGALSRIELSCTPPRGFSSCDPYEG